MPKFTELAAPVHPFLASQNVSEQETFQTPDEDDVLSWQFKHSHNHNQDLEFDNTHDLMSFNHPNYRLHHQQERTRSESLNVDPLHSAETLALSPAASFLSTFLSSSAPTSHIPPDSSGQSIAGYVLGQTIGRGGFSTIKEGRSPSGDIVAIKIVRHTAFDCLPLTQRRQQKSRFTHEARVWASLSHENILPLFQCHHTATATYLITLYCPAGSLFDILKREGTPALEQTDAGCMFRQVVKGLRYMHESMALVHCDVKLENVLVDESGVCRLADFGLTKRVGGDPLLCSSEEDEGDEDDEGAYEDEAEFNRQPLGSSSKKQRSRSRGRAGSTTLPVHLSLMRHGPQQRNRPARPRHATETLVVPRLPDYSFPPGSLQYASPELLLPRPHPSQQQQQQQQGTSNHYTAHPAQDMWALGILLYALLTGRLPFSDPYEPRLQMKIVKGTFSIPKDIGTHAEAVLKGCLHKDVSQRWNISMVEDAAWGIGYGAVDVASSVNVSEKQQHQHQQRTHLQTQAQSSSLNQMEELSSNLSHCSVGMSSLSPPLSPLLSLSSPTSSRSRGRNFTTQVRSQSRSRSPSSSPQTPIDEESIDFYENERRRSRSRPSRESVVRFVINESPTTRGRSDDKMMCRNVNLDYATAVVDEEEDCCKTAAAGTAETEMSESKSNSKDVALKVRAKSRSQSRTRSWSFNI